MVLVDGCDGLLPEGADILELDEHLPMLVWVNIHVKLEALQ